MTDKITFTITIDHDNSTITLRRSGERGPLVKVFGKGPANLAGIFDDLADFAREEANAIRRRYNLKEGKTR